MELDSFNFNYNWNKFGWKYYYSLSSYVMIEAQIQDLGIKCPRTEFEETGLFCIGRRSKRHFAKGTEMAGWNPQNLPSWVDKDVGFPASGSGGWEVGRVVERNVRVPKCLVFHAQEWDGVFCRVPSEATIVPDLESEWKHFKTEPCSLVGWNSSAEHTIFIQTFDSSVFRVSSYGK